MMKLHPTITWLSLAAIAVLVVCHFLQAKRLSWVEAELAVVADREWANISGEELKRFDTLRRIRQNPRPEILESYTAGSAMHAAQSILLYLQRPAATVEVYPEPAVSNLLAELTVVDPVMAKRLSQALENKRGSSQQPPRHVRK